MENRNNSVKITLIIAIAVLILVGLLIYFLKPSNIYNPENTIQVNGQATIKATPDLITIYYNIETEGNTSKEAGDLNSKIVQKLKEEIKKSDISEDSLKTMNYNIYPEYNWSNGNNEIIGYRATHSLKVELSANQTNKISGLVDAGINSGAGINYINFELSDKLQQEYKSQVIKSAAQDAKIKAESLAEGAGKEVGKLVSISLNEGWYNPWPIYSNERGGIEMTSQDFAVAKEAVSNINPSEQEVTASVTAVYKLR